MKYFFTVISFLIICLFKENAIGQTALRPFIATIYGRDDTVNVNIEGDCMYKWQSLSDTSLSDSGYSMNSLKIPAMRGYVKLTLTPIGANPLHYINVANERNYNIQAGEIVAIEQWGDAKWSTFAYLFAYNYHQDVSVPANEFPDLSNCKSLERVFYRSYMSTMDISNWNVSNVENMFEAFYRSQLSNVNISHWDVRKVKNMDRLFERSNISSDISRWQVHSLLSGVDMFTFPSSMSCHHYNNALVAWSRDPLTNRRALISGGLNNHSTDSVVQEAVRKLTDTSALGYGWTIWDSGPDSSCVYTPTLQPFTTKWNTANVDSLVIPLSGSYTWYWESVNNPSLKRVGGVTWNTLVLKNLPPGEILLHITPTNFYPFTRIILNGGISANQLLAIEHWGDVKWTSMENAFKGASNLTTISQTSKPNLSNVQSMKAMFYGASSLNASIRHWDVSNVTDMSYLFYGASVFNNALDNWNVSNVTDMSYMFYGALNYNSNVRNWNVSKVINTSSMFQNSAFNQNIGQWNLQRLQQAIDMFTGSNLTCYTYSSTLDGWSKNATTNKNVRFTSPSVMHGVDSITIIAKNKLTDTTTSGYKWSIVDGGVDTSCSLIPNKRPFIATLFVGDSLDIFIDGNSNYRWELIADTSINGSGTDFQGHLKIYNLYNPVRLSITPVGDTGFHFMSLQNNIYSGVLMSVEQWGDVKWSSLADFFAYNGQQNISIPTTEAPDLSVCKSLSRLFYRSYITNAAIEHWDVSAVEDMSYMFYRTTTLNPNISQWDVRNVKYMSSMFEHSDVSRDLSSWKIHSLISGDQMFTNSAMNCFHYSNALVAWSLDANTNRNVSMHNSGAVHSDELHVLAAIQKLSDSSSLGFNWSFSDYGQDSNCRVQPLGNAFVTHWNSPNANFTLPIYAQGAYYWKWESLNNPALSNIGMANGNTVMDNLPMGLIKVTLTPAGTNPLHAFSTNNLTPNQSAALIAVENWGDVVWSTMNNMFSNATQLNQLPTSQAPNLSRVTNMDQMFYNASSFNQSINHWDVSHITSMKGLFKGATAFNQPLNNWNMGNVTNIDELFMDATSFNQAIANWNVSNITRMQNVFSGATSFSQPLNDWSISNVTTAYGMFFNASSFNQSLSDWDVTNIEDMSYMFKGATAFDQPIKDWNLKNAQMLFGIFSNSGMSCENYSYTLIGWKENPNTNKEVYFNDNFSVKHSIAPQTINAVAYLSIPVSQGGLGWIFEDGGVDTSCIVDALPLELISFTAVKNNFTVSLAWATASEFNNVGFEIQRSHNGNDWDNIGFVNSAAPNGNSNEILSYHWDDMAPLNGKNMYRLKQIDFSGAYHYSPVRIVDIAHSSLYDIYPNPAKETIRISQLKGTETIYIYNAVGIAVLHIDANQTTSLVDISNIPAGVYLMKITDQLSNADSYHKFIKE